MIVKIDINKEDLCILFRDIGHYPHDTGYQSLDECDDCGKCWFDALGIEILEE